MSAAQSLMRALDVSTGNLDAFGQTYLKENREEQFKQGQMKAQESQEKFADAVAKGVIPATANPWFIKGYQNQDGRVQGLDYYTQMQAAYLKSPAKGNDDPAAYEKFSTDFKKQYMGALPTDRSSDWWGGFQQTAATADERMSRDHAENVQQAVIAKQATNTGAEINVILNSTKDPVEAAQRINALGDKMRLEGMPPAAYQEVAAQAVLAKAKLGDPNFLTALDHIKTSDGASGATLSSNPKVQMARVDVSQWLTDKARSATEFAWAADNHAYQVNVVRPRAEEAYKHEQDSWARSSATWGRQEQSRSLLSQIQAATIAHPETAYAETRPLLDKLSQVDPGSTEAASNFVKGYIGGTTTVAADVEAPVAAGFRDRIIRSAGDPAAQRALMLDINQAVTDKHLNRGTYNDLFIFSREMASYDPSYVKKLNSPELDGVKTAAKGMLTQKDQNPFGILYGKANSDYLHVVDAINNAALDYLKKKPDATAIELRQEGEKVLNALMPTLVPQHEQGTFEQLGQKAQKAATAPPPTSLPVPQSKAANAPATTDKERDLGKLAPQFKTQLIKEAAAAYAQGPQAFQQYIMKHDEALGRPGITAAIIEEANKPRPTSTKRP